MSVKSLFLLFLNLSLSLTTYASTLDDEAKYYQEDDIVPRTLSEKKKKDEELELEKYASELEKTLEKPFKKRKVSNFSFNNHPLFYPGVKEPLIEIFAKGEDTKVSLKSLHNFLITSKKMDNAENWGKAINLARGSLFNVNFRRQKIDSSLKELFTDLRLKENPKDLGELRIKFRFYGNKLLNQIEKLYLLEHTELAPIIVHPKIETTFQSIALNHLLSKFIEGRNDYKQRKLNAIKAFLLEKISSKTLKVEELSKIVKVLHFDEDVKKKTLEELIRRNESYKDYSLEQLLVIYENLSYGNASIIESIQDIIRDKLRKSDQVLSSSVLIDFSLKTNIPTSLKTLLIASVPTSLKNSQDVEEFINNLYTTYSMRILNKKGKEMVVKLFSQNLLEGITPHLRSISVSSLRSLQIFIEGGAQLIKIYLPLNILVENAINERKKALIAELLPIEELLRLNNEWIPARIKSNTLL